MKSLILKERYLRALRREPVDRVPIPAFCSHPLLDLMKVAGFFAPGIHYELEDRVGFALAAREVLGFEGVRLPTDGVIEAEAFGCRTDPGDTERNPSLVDHPFSLDGFKVPENVLGRGRIPLLLEAIGTARRKAGNELPITSQFMGPVTISCHLVSSETFLLGLIENPEGIKRVLESVTDVCIQMGNALGEAGADVLQFPDPMASSDIMSPGMFREWVLPCYKRIFENVTCPVVLHICGNTNPLLPLLKGSGATGFSFDTMVSVSHVRDILCDDMALVGNISTTDTLLRGTKEDVKRETLKAIGEGVDVLASSCGFAPRTPIENVREMIRSVKGLFGND
jgi:[methyl-Co(III) methanol-specific corrinoid protein]:coenzyme M methyltransferase